MKFNSWKTRQKNAHEKMHQLPLFQCTLKNPHTLDSNGKFLISHMAVIVLYFDAHAASFCHSSYQLNPTYYILLTNEHSNKLTIIKWCIWWQRERKSKKNAIYSGKTRATSHITQSTYPLLNAAAWIKFTFVPKCSVHEMQWHQTHSADYRNDICFFSSLSLSLSFLLQLNLFLF